MTYVFDLKNMFKAVKFIANFAILLIVYLFESSISCNISICAIIRHQTLYSSNFQFDQKINNERVNYSPKYIMLYPNNAYIN
jgi:hypothetical protein